MQTLYWTFTKHVKGDNSKLRKLRTAYKSMISAFILPQEN